MTIFGHFMLSLSFNLLTPKSLFLCLSIKINFYGCGSFIKEPMFFSLLSVLNEIFREFLHKIEVIYTKSTLKFYILCVQSMKTF